MTNFRQPPEWRQAADRHTELPDPVLTVRQLSFWENMGRKHPTRIDNAHVCVTPQHTYDTYMPPQRPNLARKRYTAVYEIDVGVHPVHTELRLPSDNDAIEFGADAEFAWQVVAPARFVASGHRDVPKLLLSELQERARPVTRGFPIAESARAEQALLTSLGTAAPLGTAAGLRVTWTVRIRRDDENLAHERRLQSIDHASAEAVREAQQSMVLDAAQDMRARQQDQLQFQRAEQYAERHQELAMRQLQWQHEQAMLSGTQQSELRELEAEKIKFYQNHLERGGARAWAMHLAQHPEDSLLVMQNLREDQLRYLRSQIDIVTQVLGNGHTEPYQLEGVQQAVLQIVQSYLPQQHANSDDTPAAPQPAPPLTAPAEAPSGAPTSTPPSWPAPPPYAPPPPPSFGPPTPPSPPLFAPPTPPDRSGEERDSHSEDSRSGDSDSEDDSAPPDPARQAEAPGPQDPADAPPPADPRGPEPSAQP